MLLMTLAAVSSPAVCCRAEMCLCLLQPTSSCLLLGLAGAIRGLLPNSEAEEGRLPEALFAPQLGGG